MCNLLLLYSSIYGRQQHPSSDLVQDRFQTMYGLRSSLAHEPAETMPDASMASSMVMPLDHPPRFTVPEDARSEIDDDDMELAH